LNVYGNPGDLRLAVWVLTFEPELLQSDVTIDIKGVISMKKIATFFIVVFSMAFVVEAQRAARTITNADLAKFRDRRVAAEQEYRDNYERLGMPSPEELDAMRERDMDARLVLAEQLRQARLEKDRLELDRARLDLDADRLALERESIAESQAINQSYGYGGVYGGFYGGFGYPGLFGRGFGFADRFPGYVPLRGYPRNRLLPMFSVPTYRYTPGGVITGNQVLRPLPLNRAPRRGPRR
jgi:hypothetical protein